MLQELGQTDCITQDDYMTAYEAVLDIAGKCSCAVRDFAALEFALVIALEHPWTKTRR